MLMRRLVKRMAAQNHCLLCSKRLRSSKARRQKRSLRRRRRESKCLRSRSKSSTTLLRASNTPCCASRSSFDGFLKPAIISNRCANGFKSIASRSKLRLLNFKVEIGLKNEMYVAPKCELSSSVRLAREKTMAIFLGLVSQVF